MLRLVGRAPARSSGLRTCLLIAVLGLILVPQAACLVQLRGAPGWTPSRKQGPATGSLQFVVRLHSARRAATRAHLHMSGDGSAPGRPGKNNVPFRAGDPELFKAMAEAEAQAGNTTGATALSGIADRMQAIMDRSTAKLARKLDIAGIQRIIQSQNIYTVNMLGY